MLICNKLKRFIVYISTIQIVLRAVFVAYYLRRCGYMLVLLGKIIGASKYTILAFKFVKKSGSEIYYHKNVLHRLCNQL